LTHQRRRTERGIWQAHGICLWKSGQINLLS
jgi:hypothetical protein